MSGRGSSKKNKTKFGYYIYVGKNNLKTIE